MKKLLMPTFLFLAMFISFSSIALANTLEVPTFITDVVLPFLFERFPFLGHVMLLVGFFRLVFKPIMEAVENFFGFISYDRGTRKINAMRESKIYYWISFVLDYLFSVKTKKKNDKTL